MIKKICIICGKKFITRLGEINRGYGKTCSVECGYKTPRNQEDNNANWKGDKVGKGVLHEWVTIRYPKTPLCENCKIVPPYDLANKGVYNRELKNWKWLCRRCHMIEDGRMNKFIKRKKCHADLPENKY
jgi:hypothetical protein